MTQQERRAEEARQKCISKGCLWTAEEWQRVRASGNYDEEQYRAWSEWNAYRRSEK